MIQTTYKFNYPPSFCLSPPLRPRWQVSLPNAELCRIWIMPFQGRPTQPRIKIGFGWKPNRNQTSPSRIALSTLCSVQCAMHLHPQEGNPASPQKLRARLPNSIFPFLRGKKPIQDSPQHVSGGWRNRWFPGVRCKCSSFEIFGCKTISELGNN